MTATTQLAMSRRVPAPFEETVARTRAALQGEGFGVLTEVDVRSTLREKLDVDFRNYVIIGACNPSLAHRALQEDLDVGLLLPCNVVVYDDGAESVVSMFDPEVGMALAGVPALDPIAIEARQRLKRALDAI